MLFHELQCCVSLDIHTLCNMESRVADGTILQSLDHANSEDR